MTDRVEYRLATGPEDFAPTFELFLRAANDLRTKTHRDLLDDTVARRTRALAFREHAFRHAAEGFWLAENDGQRIGFGIATTHPGFWHLNALHVAPEFQAMGVGRELLKRCLAYGRDGKVVSTVISEAAQPISNALYARHGMYQWLPLVHIECPVFSPEIATRRRAPTSRVVQLNDATLAAVDRIDAAVLGFTRRVDHLFWIGLPDLNLLLLEVAAEPVGYAYISRFGGIGPCASRSPRQLPDLLAHSIHISAERGMGHVRLVVPGIASNALAYLLAHGGRYDASITLLLSSAPFGHLERYLLSASDALF